MGPCFAVSARSIISFVLSRVFVNYTVSSAHESACCCVLFIFSFVVFNRLCEAQIGEEVKDFVDKLVLAVDSVVAVDRGAEGTRQLKQKNCQDTVNYF